MCVVVVCVVRGRCAGGWGGAPARLPACLLMLLACATESSRQRAPADADRRMPPACLMPSGTCHCPCPPSLHPPTLTLTHRLTPQVALGEFRDIAVAEAGSGGGGEDDDGGGQFRRSGGFAEGAASTSTSGEEVCAPAERRVCFCGEGATEVCEAALAEPSIEEVAGCAAAFAGGR